MSPEYVVSVGRQALEMMLIVSAPVLLTALGVGLIVSLLQAVTQINEATLTFVPKVLAVSVVMACAAMRTRMSRPWRRANSAEHTMAAAAPQVGGQH